MTEWQWLKKKEININKRIKSMLNFTIRLNIQAASVSADVINHE